GELDGAIGEWRGECDVDGHIRRGAGSTFHHVYIAGRRRHRDDHFGLDVLAGIGVHVVMAAVNAAAIRSDLDDPGAARVVSRAVSRSPLAGSSQVASEHEQNIFLATAWIGKTANCDYFPEIAADDYVRIGTDVGNAAVIGNEVT